MPYLKRWHVIVTWERVRLLLTAAKLAQVFLFSVDKISVILLAQLQPESVSLCHLNNREELVQGERTWSLKL